jgi:hypothetical protein
MNSDSGRTVKISTFGDDIHTVVIASCPHRRFVSHDAELPAACP